MTWELYQSDNDIDFIIKEYGYYIIRFGMGVTGALGNFIGAVASNFEKLNDLLDLTEMLGFSFDEIYQEYLNKNKINYERLKNGYWSWQHKQSGLRPCIIVSNDFNNSFCDLVTIIPVTTKKDNLPQHRSIMLRGRKIISYQSG